MWFQSKIQYKAVDKTGKLKTITEEFLHDAVSPTEVEAHLHKILPPRVRDFHTRNINHQTFSDVVFHKDGDYFYKVNVRFIEDDLKSFTKTIVIPADTLQEATERVYDFLDGSQIEFKIVSVSTSGIIGVWHPLNEIWQGDFYNRMEYLESRGRKSAPKNQMDIDFDPKQDQPESDPDAVTALVVLGVVACDAEDLGNGYDGDGEHLEPVRELGGGNVLQLNAGSEFEPAA